MTSVTSLLFPVIARLVARTERSGMRGWRGAPALRFAPCGLLLASALLFANPAAAQEPTEAEIEANLEGLTVMRSFAEFGEPKYGDDFAQFDYVDPDAPRGGRIRVSDLGSFERLDTILVGGDWPTGLGHVLEGLMTGSEDELASYYPLIAEHVAVPDDLGYAIFTINPEARWHDGEPITAQDFVFAFDFIKEHARPLLREFWSDLEGATALNDRQIRFDFATRNNRQTLGMAAGFGPMPQHFWEASGRDMTEPTLEPALYSGPYSIARVDPGRSITYARVEDYWGADLPVNVGQNNFDEITYVYYRDDDIRFQAFLAGEYDYRVENRGRRWAESYDTDAVERGDIVRDTVPVNSPVGARGYFLNTRRPIFQDIRIREALQYFYDFEWLNENIHFGMFRRATSSFPNSDFGTEDFPLPTETELELLEPFRGEIPDEIFTEPFEVPETDGSGRIRGQIRQALALFEEAGWEVRDGVMTSVETGEPFRFEIMLTQGQLLEEAEAFVSNLALAGIEAEIRVIDSAQWGRRTQNKDFDAMYAAFNFFPPPAGELRTYFSSEARDEFGSANLSGVADPVVDHLLEIIATERSDEERLEAATRALDRVLLRGYYLIPSYLPRESRIAYWNVFGRPETQPFYGDGFPTTWWHDAQAAATVDRTR